MQSVEGQTYANSDSVLTKEVVHSWILNSSRTLSELLVVSFSLLYPTLLSLYTPFGLGEIRKETTKIVLGRVNSIPGLGIYKRKKKTRKKTRTKTRKSCTSECLRACFLARVLFCVDAFLYECVFSCVFACFRACLRGRVRVFFLACFLFFFYKFQAQDLWLLYSSLDIVTLTHNLQSNSAHIGGAFLALWSYIHPLFWLIMYRNAIVFLAIMVYWLFADFQVYILPTFRRWEFIKKDFKKERKLAFDQEKNGDSRLTPAWVWQHKYQRKLRLGHCLW